MFRLSQFIIVMFMVLLLASCYNTRKIEGNYIFPNNLNKLKIGMNKEEVYNLVGPSTFKSNFNENLWYYSYEAYSKALSFSNKEIVDSALVIVAFSPNNTISNIKVLTKKDRKNIPISNKKTKDILKAYKTNDTRIRNIDSLK